MAAQAEEPEEPCVAQPLLRARRAQERGLGPGHHPPGQRGPPHQSLRHPQLVHSPTADTQAQTSIPSWKLP